MTVHAILIYTDIKQSLSKPLSGDLHETTALQKQNDLIQWNDKS